MKSLWLLFLLDTILIVTGGCVVANGLVETPNHETSPTLIDGKFSSTTMYTQIISSATSKSTLTPTLIPTNTSTPIITPTAIPTMPVEAARTRILDLLTNNSSCRLPCLWGMTPGKSTYHEAQIILIPLSSVSDFTAFSPGVGNIAPNFAEGDIIIYINVDFLTNDEIVSSIVFTGRALKEMTGERGVVGVFDSMVFGERLSLFMLPHILSQYGRPTSVMLTTLAEPPPQSRGGDIGYFKIILLYPDDGILVTYITQIHVVGENVLGCPTNAHVELRLYPVGDGDSFLENLDTSLQEYIQNNYKPVEEVTSMSLDDFYQTFRQPTEECLVTPANLWPVTER